MKFRRGSGFTWREVGAFLLVLLASLLLWTLAYQVPFTLRLAVGGDSETHRREDDAPFLSGFHESQPASEDEWRWWLLEPGYGYRWTEERARVQLPGIGGGQWIVSLHASSGRPDNQSAESIWQVEQQPALALAVPPNDRVYHLLAPADTTGDLTLTFDTSTFTPPADPRALGFVLRELAVAPAGDGLRLPALAQVGWLALFLVLAYALARWLVLRARAALLLALASGALLALLLALQRFTLTLFAPTLAGLALACWGLALAAYLGAGGWRAGWAGWWRPREAAPGLLAVHRQSGAVLAVALLAFGLRAGGMLHPVAIFSDHLLHANNLLEVGLGNVYFTEGLPDTRGGGDAPYPPGFYLLLAPALVFAPADMASRALIVQLGVALLDSMALVLLWLLLRRAGFGQRAALWGAALYLLPLPILISFSIGEYANLGGQLLALPVLALLALGGARGAQGAPRGTASRRILVLALLFSLGLLGHLGVAISLVLVLVAGRLLSVVSWLINFVRRRTGTTQPIGPVILIAGGALALVLVVVFYYSAPLFVEIIAGRLTGTATGEESGAGTPLLAAAGQIVTDLFTPGSRLHPLVVLAGVAGLLLAWRRGLWAGTLEGASFRLLLLTWYAGVLLSLGLLLVAAQGVRWQHFLFPALCLGGGVLLAALARRGKAGRMVAWLLLLAVLAHAFFYWSAWIYEYLH